MIYIYNLIAVKLIAFHVRILKIVNYINDGLFKVATMGVFVHTAL